MSYVEGGIYISYNDLYILSLAMGPAGAGTVGALTAYFATNISAICFWFNALPIVGQIAFCWAVANASVLAGTMVTAYFMKKGVDITVGWAWFVPYINAQIC